MVTAQVIAQFVAEMGEMFSTVDSLNSVLDAIGGEQFREVAEKMRVLDATQSGGIAMLSGVPLADSGVLRAGSVRHDQVGGKPNPCNENKS